MPQTIPGQPFRALARPERWRLALWEDADGGTTLALPRRSAKPVAILVAILFVILAAVLASEISSLNLRATNSVSSLMEGLFKAFWILGWSIGVLILGALAVLLFFYRESVQLARGRLICASSLGPLKMIAEYDLARIRNLRIETRASGLRVRFDYGDGSRDLGDTMPEPEAERLVTVLRSAIPAAADAPAADASARHGSAPPAIAPPREAAPRPLSLGSAFALIAANLLPLFGVLFLGWRLDDVIVLFWAESAVIGFYTLLKMAVVGKWMALPYGVFFAGHFGGFMAIHFLFVYELFLRGLNASGREPAAVEALLHIFTPLWPALLVLFLSHGLSFAQNFIGRQEYKGATISGLMGAPYRRVILMQITLIAGGWLIMELNSPAAALVLLIVLKMVADLQAHRSERAPRSP